MDVYIRINSDGYVVHSYIGTKPDKPDDILVRDEDIFLLRRFGIKDFDDHYNFKYINHALYRIPESEKFDLTKYKDARIKKLNELAYVHITDTLGYPLWKQQQINNYKKYKKWKLDDYNKMHRLINAALDKQNELKQQILDAKTREEVDAVVLKFE